MACGRPEEQTMKRDAVWMLILSSALWPAGSSAQTKSPEMQRVEEITGLSGTFIEAENVFKVTSPRADVKVAVDGWAMPPFMGLTSWAAFQAARSGKAMSWVISSSSRTR
jgi:hypothetical protein